MPVLATKLYAPAQRGRVVSRGRLTEAVDALLDPGQRLAVVAAPAGFGKTTLVSSWTKAISGDPRREVSVAWVSLDEADNDLGRMVTHLLAALEGAGVPVDVDAAGVMGAGGLDVAAATALLAGVVNRVAHAVARGAVPETRRWLLVLDDYHVISSPEVHATVTSLLDHAPEQLRLLVATRSDPPLPVARLRSRGQLTELRAADLRFTPEEAGDFLTGVMDLDLAADAVEALERRTEGWAAGLQLAGLSLRGRTGAGDVTAFIEAFTGSNRFVVDYLADEVLARQPSDVRDFLLHTSVLDRLTGSLCDAVTGRSDSAEVLERLDRDNLFVVPLDDQRTWYRYHHLFADVLRARLLAGEPGTAPDLHRAAADWYAAHDALEDAIRHALAGHDVVHAGRLVEAAVSATRRQRRDTLLLTWIRALPDDVVRPHPVLGTVAAWASMMAGDLDGMERRLDDADRALAAAADDPSVATPWVDTEDLRAAPAAVQMYRAALALARGDSEGTTAHARAALALVGAEDHFVSAGAAGFLGLAAWARGDIEVALPTFERSVASLRAAGNLVDALDATVVLADMWVTAGLPSRARALCEATLRTATEHGEPYPRATADLHTWLAELALARDDLAEAEDELATAATLAERGSITENRHRWPTVAAGVRAARGQHEQALLLLDEAAQLHRAGFYPDLHPVDSVRARVHLARGDLRAATQWAAAADVALTDLPRFAREHEHLTLVRVHLALHRSDEAERAHLSAPHHPDLAGVAALLGRLEVAAASDHRQGSLLEVRLLQALALQARGDGDAALARLAYAVTEAPELDHHVRLFVDACPALDPLLVRAAEGPEADPLSAFARRLLRPDRARDLVAPAVLPDPLSEREAQVLGLLASELTGPEIARHLFISLNTLRTHTKRIFTKLDVSSRSAAVRRARELGLL